MLAHAAQLECPVLHRHQRLVLVLLALVLLALVLYRQWLVPRPAAWRHQSRVARVVDTWVLYRQRLVLELLAPAPGQCLVHGTFHCCSQCQCLAHLLQRCYCRQRLAHCC